MTAKPKGTLRWWMGGKVHRAKVIYALDSRMAVDVGVFQDSVGEEYQ